MITGIKVQVFPSTVNTTTNFLMPISMKKRNEKEHFICKEEKNFLKMHNTIFCFKRGTKQHGTTEQVL